MNKIFNAVKLFVTGIFLCGVVLIGGRASAAEVNQEGIEMLRETLAHISTNDSRVFHQEIFFVMPKFFGELQFMGLTENDHLKLKGNFEIWTTDDKDNFKNFANPFYLTQDKENMVLYFQEDKKWKKMTTPVTVANAADTVTTPTAEELQKMTEFVKDVAILQDNDKQRTLLVKIDCEKVADTVAKMSEELKTEMKAEMNKDSNGNEQLNDEVTKTIMSCLDRGFRNADIWLTWTVDKTNWQTTTASCNLSGLSQSIANAALNTPLISDLGFFNEILENVAFYSEFKGYTTFLNPAAKSQLEIPKNVLKAKEVKTFNEDEKAKKK